ncbi:hypothetical protein AB1N83_006516 [Pleurotus pulmonarius]
MEAEDELRRSLIRSHESNLALNWSQSHETRNKHAGGRGKKNESLSAIRAYTRSLFSRGSGQTHCTIEEAT